ncbi:S41 family peptidase [Candidatus Riflebacteria bacterium]
MSGYYLRFPGIYKEKVFFLADNTLWQGRIGEENLVPLHSAVAGISTPKISPDGKYLAFASAEEGPIEIYCLELITGNCKRLTFHPEGKKVAGWSKDSNQILFHSSMENEGRVGSLFSIAKEGGLAENQNIGPMNHIHFAENSSAYVCGRGNIDPSIWKGYRGGLTGKIHFNKGNGSFQLLTKGALPQCQPYIHGKRIYFISDTDGNGNIYSFNFQGKNLKQHTFFKDFYVGYPHLSGNKLIFQKAGELFLLDLKNDSVKKLSFQIPGYGPQKTFYFAPVEEYIHYLDLAPNGKNMCMNARGKLFHLPNWEGTPKELGIKAGVRYRLSQFVDDNSIICTTDKGGEERIEFYDLKKNRTSILTEKAIPGRVAHMVTSHDGKQLLYAYHNRLMLMNIKSKKTKMLDKSEYGPIQGFSFSPDDRYICYVRAEKENYCVYIYDIKAKKAYNVAGSEWDDFAPRFDTYGRFLYFLSRRYLDPYRDHTDHDYGYPNTLKPFLIVLDKDLPSPFTSKGKSFIKAAFQKNESDKKKKKKKKLKLKIDFKDIEGRIFEFPLPAKPYKSLFQRGNRVFFLSAPLIGLRGYPDIFDLRTRGDKTLEYFDLLSGEWHVFSRNLMGADDSTKSDFILLKKFKGIRVINCVQNPEEKALDKSSNTLLGGKVHFSESSGWVNLERVNLNVDLLAEWRQIFVEAWRLARDFFWRADMDGIDWNGVKKKYLPILPRIANRHDLQDLLWQLYGEMRTSHAYVMGGDFKMDENFSIGLLGCDYSWHAKKGGYEIRQIYRGDSFIKEHYSPLTEPGINVETGDILHAIDGEKLTQKVTPNQLLVKKSGIEVTLTIQRQKSRKKEEVEVKTLEMEKPLRYRDWVVKNRNYVKRKTSKKVGYIHLPNMHLAGINEFTRSFHPQAGKKALIIDVRNNGGGHVSQIIIAKLKKHLVGMTVSRWFGSHTDPYHSFTGPLVAICNEYTGSDGDIFCVSFQDLKMGPIIGTRTWGGVIGIMPRMKAVDNTVFTQPEFASWFPKKGFRVENHGADPDIVLDNTPEDITRGDDHQLDKAIELATELMKSWNYSAKVPALDPPIHLKK